MGCWTRSLPLRTTTSSRQTARARQPATAAGQMLRTSITQCWPSRSLILMFVTTAYLRTVLTNL